MQIVIGRSRQEGKGAFFSHWQPRKGIDKSPRSKLETEGNQQLHERCGSQDKRTF